MVDFAAALKIVDAREPDHVSRSGRAYQPGIGPFAEDVAVDLITREMKTARPGVYDTMNCHVAYSGSKQKCDLVIDGAVPFHIEIKMARLYGNNGKPDDTGIKDILSPFVADRSAVADAVKLTRDASLGHARREAQVVSTLLSTMAPPSELAFGLVQPRHHRLAFGLESERDLRYTGCGHRASSLAGHTDASTPLL